jgi:hypothetical protein
MNEVLDFLRIRDRLADDDAFDRHDALGNPGSHGASRGQGPRSTAAPHFGPQPGGHSLCRRRRHAVASWVSTIDEGAVRNTRDVDLLVRRADLPALTAALSQAGFIPEKSFGVTMFLDGSDAKPSESVRLLFAGEKEGARSGGLPGPADGRRPGRLPGD